MIFDACQLHEILGAPRMVGVRDDEQFGWLNITGLPEFANIKSTLPEPLSILYFVTHDSGVSGWYEPFDRKKNIAERSCDPRAVFVVDDHVSDKEMKGLRYIRVSDIFKAIDILRKHVLSVINPKLQVIGVAGSIGKTDCALLIESMLGTDCARVHATKRVTPLTLSSWIVNFLEPHHKWLVVEYSMTRIGHISMLANMLSPHIGVFLNVDSRHVGVGGIKTLDQVLQAHRPLIDMPLIVIRNADDSRVIDLKRKDIHTDLTFSLMKATANAYISTPGRNPILGLIVGRKNRIFTFESRLRTELFYQQACAAALVAVHEGVEKISIKEAMEKF